MRFTHRHDRRLAYREGFEAGLRGDAPGHLTWPRALLRALGDGVAAGAQARARCAQMERRASGADRAGLPL